MIYFLQPLDGGPVKIGTTEDIPVRHKMLEAHYGRPLAVLATLEGGRDEERELHERFAHLRLGRTEQFRPGPDLMEFIGRPLLVGANPDMTEAMPPATKSTNPIALTIRGSVEWREWVERGAEHCRTDTAKLVDASLIRYLKEQGFTEAPPKR